MIDIFVLKLFGYGIGINYRKLQERPHRKNKDLKNNGFRFVKTINEFQDIQFSFIFPNRTAISIRIYLNR